METIVSTLALPRASAGLVTAASPGLRQRLLAVREPQAEDHIRLDFSATECSARRQNSLQLPTHEATPTSASKKISKGDTPMSTVLSGLIAPSQPAPAQRRVRTGIAWALAANLEVSQRIFANLAERRRVARAVAQLEGLSDRMLADIGLQRCDITRVARHGRDAHLRSFLGAMR